MMPLSHTVRLTKTDGPGGPAKHRHQPPSSQRRGDWWNQPCTGLILATDKDTYRVGTFGISWDVGKPSVVIRSLEK